MFSVPPTTCPTPPTTPPTMLAGVWASCSGVRLPAPEEPGSGSPAAGLGHQLVHPVAPANPTCVASADAPAGRGHNGVGLRQQQLALLGRGNCGNGCGDGVRTSVMSATHFGARRSSRDDRSGSAYLAGRLDHHDLFDYLLAGAAALTEGSARTAVGKSRATPGPAWRRSQPTPRSRWGACRSGKRTGDGHPAGDTRCQKATAVNFANNRTENALSTAKPPRFGGLRGAHPLAA